MAQEMRLAWHGRIRATLQDLAKEISSCIVYNTKHSAIKFLSETQLQDFTDAYNDVVFLLEELRPK